MKIRILSVIVMFSMFSLLSGCCGNGETKNEKKSAAVVKAETVDKSGKDKYFEEGSKITKQTFEVLKKNLTNAIVSGGVDHAVEFCHKRAMMLTDSLSHVNGVKIKRLAKRNRNPFNFLDEQGTQVFAEYKKDLELNKPLKPMVKANKEGNPVYYAPIVIKKGICLKCHGTVGKEITQERYDMIKKFYPEDKAINFRMNDLRGIWAVTFVNNKLN